VTNLKNPKEAVRFGIRVACTALIVFSLSALGEQADERGFEPPPTLAAGDLVPGILLAGAHYRIDERVPTDGYLTHVSIQSDFGAFKAVGPGMLEVRLREIDALGKLREMEDSEELQTGAKDSANKILGGVKHFIDEPESTLKGIPEGVGRFFQRTYRSAKTGVQKLQDVNAGRAPGAPTPSGPGARLPGGVQTGAADAQRPDMYQAAAGAVGHAAVNALGYDEARRRLAKRLGVDPYTANRLLAEKLDEVAWSAFAGGLGVNALTAMVPGGTLLATSTRLSNWVWDTPPGDLRVQIERSLLAMGIPQQDVDLLLRHRWYPLSLQAALAVALDDLDGVQGRTAVMPLALTVASEEQARYLVETLRMTARYHQSVKPLKELLVLGTVVAHAQDGELVVAAPVDYLSWNQGVARFVGQPELAAASRSIYLAGRLTERARSELEGQGWAVHANTGLFEPILSVAPEG
jgi:hypothetical protein